MPENHESRICPIHIGTLISYHVLTTMRALIATKGPVAYPFFGLTD